MRRKPPRNQRGQGPDASLAPTFDLSVAIRRPPSAVFALLADIQDFEPIPRRESIRMVKEPAAPTAMGTRWHEWVRLGPGCWFRTESVVSEFDPPHLLGMDLCWFGGGQSSAFSSHCT